MGVALITAVIVIGVLGLLAVIGLVGRKVVRLSTDIASVAPGLGQARLMSPARYGGGGGAEQGRIVGNGALGLLPNELRFVLAVPSRVVSIPLSSITTVEITRTLRVPGRVRHGGGRWLVVRWDHEGSEAVAGFQLAEPDRWKAELAHALPAPDGSPGSL